MDLKEIFTLNGLNLWLVVSGIGMNLILEFALLMGAASVGGSSPALAQTLLVLGSFLLTALVAFVCGRIERERYLSYGFITLIGNLIVTVPSIVLGAGLTGIIIVLVSVMGAFNGARFADMSVHRHVR